MKTIALLQILLLFYSEQSFSFEGTQNCNVKNIDISHLEDGSEADEIMEVWCINEISKKLELVSQCFTYYKYSEVNEEVIDSKVKCNYY